MSNHEKTTEERRCLRSELSALLSCPFCGGVPVLEEIEPHAHHLDLVPDHPGSWTIECDSCRCGTIGEDIEELKGHWNKRVERVPPLNRREWYQKGVAAGKKVGCPDWDYTDQECGD